MYDISALILKEILTILYLQYFNAKHGGIQRCILSEKCYVNSLGHCHWENIKMWNKGYGCDK